MQHTWYLFYYLPYAEGLGQGYWQASHTVLYIFLIGAKYSLQPLSILLDYLLAYGVLGLAGLAGTYPAKYKGLLVALGAMLCRMICSILSGAIVFAAYAPAGMNPWLYSISYNSSVMLPDIAINLIVLWILYQKVVRLPRT